MSENDRLMSTVTACYNATVIQMTKMSQWPTCLSKKWPKCLIDKNTDFSQYQSWVCILFLCKESRV